ncbi:hypothetical protein [Flagellimonas allohymeniacidonis]|uniref:Lipoprotein n=1 Tax=Flagellimonas allohymeniacidonis TaxID=2517819 RepID=A0A4Q8QKF6_9FLAO|nr:hypothetical protein [Allomuricauda hymeniacidonis]TAI48999.1 hypothetical protein EW142_04175 [Allomuricauda hymeniacidonis]
MKKVIAIVVVLALSSCNLFKENGIDFKIVNSSESQITDVKFYTTEKIQIAEFDKIERNKSVSDFLSMKDNQADGEYVLEFTRANGKKESSAAGYYTNGGSLNGWVRFEIKSDTTFIKFGNY